MSSLLVSVRVLGVSDIIETFVKLFRKFTEWEWYDDINVSRVFLHLLITVNWTDKKWKGQEIKRGSIVSSYEDRKSVV